MILPRSGEADMECLGARAGKLSQKAMCLYAHIMLESVDLARELLNDPLKFDTDVLKVHEPPGSEPYYHVLLRSQIGASCTCVATFCCA